MKNLLTIRFVILGRGSAAYFLETESEMPEEEEEEEEEEHRSETLLSFLLSDFPATVKDPRLL